MKFLISVLVLLSMTNSFASNTKYFKIAPGKNTFVDVVYNKERGIISLLLETNSTDKNAEPKVTVEKSWRGFECKHFQNLIKFAGFDQKNQNFFREYEIQIEWQKGVDLSGCLVKVEFPGQKTSTAEIFVNY